MDLLIGVVTYNGHEYCLEEFLKGIANLSYPEFDLIFIDNSEDKGEYKELIQSKAKEKLKGKKVRVKVIKDTNSYPSKFEKINGGRLLLKEQLQKADYKYFMHLDSDIIPPKDTVEKLLEPNKDVVSGVYLNALVLNNKPHVLPMLYEAVNDKELRILRRTEVYTNKIIEIGGGGFGCVLMKADVLKNLKLDNSKYTDDVRFFKEAKEKGYETYANTAVKCGHINYPLDDERNIFFQWSYYIPISS